MTPVTALDNGFGFVGRGVDTVSLVTTGASEPFRQDADCSAPTRREQILQAARAAIEEHGPGALTGQIAQHAGLARPNVYRHFSSKDDLDSALARSAYREVRAEIRQRLDLSGTPLDVIRAPIAAQISWAHHHPNLYRFLVSRGYQRSSERLRADRSDLAAEVTAAGARYFPGFADDPEAAEATVVAVVGLVDASVLRWLSRPMCSREELVERLTAQAWLIVDHYLRGMGITVDPAVPLP